MEESEANALVAECNTLSVTTAEQYQYAAQKRALLKAGMDYFSQLYDDRISEAYKHHRGLVADKAKFYEPLKNMFVELGKRMAHFDSRMEAKRQQEQRAAERAKEEERKRLADLAREMGAKEAAEKIEQAPVEPVVVPKGTPQIDNLHFTTNKHYDVADLKALVKAVAEGKAPIGALTFDKSFINKQTHALFDSIEPDKKGVKWLYPGVKIWSTKTPVQKG